MSEEVIKQAMNLFDKVEKWDAFLELSNKRGDIINRYFGRLKSRINQLSVNNESISWNLLINTQESYRWYINDVGPNSICINWDLNCFRLWCDPNFRDAGKAKRLLTQSEFLPIRNCFQNLDTISNPVIHHFFEDRNRFSFSDGLSYSVIEAENRDKLSWFAGNKTDEMAKLIMDKVNRFWTPEITQLLRELNAECKK
jgi:hypothetical protein